MAVVLACHGSSEDRRIARDWPQRAAAVSAEPKPGLEVWRPRDPAGRRVQRCELRKRKDDLEMQRRMGNPND